MKAYAVRVRDNYYRANEHSILVICSDCLHTERETIALASLHVQTKTLDIIFLLEVNIVTNTVSNRIIIKCTTA